MIIEIVYLLAAVLFILGIKGLTRIKTARRGNFLSALGMFIAVVATLYKMHVGDASLGMEPKAIGWGFIISGFVIGGLIGLIFSKKVQMTEMPQLVAIFNGFGGGASVLVALSYYWSRITGGVLLDPIDIVTVLFSIIVGTVTFTGSIVAFGKLHRWIPSKPMLFFGSHFLNLVLFLGIIGVSIHLYLLRVYPNAMSMKIVSVLILIGTAFVLGILLVTPIGGADMPVVISLLNSYSGIAAAGTGFVLKNELLIISGALVGASGLILTSIMCKAMNRSLGNVLFGGFGNKDEGKSSSGGEYKDVKEISCEEVALMLESVDSVVFIPGYGMAVAQAQYAVHELAEELEKMDIDVKFAIHPVAGRMPGHMNVLLAEANVEYEKIYDLESINNDFKNTDIVFVIGANDVVNPAAANDKSSPIYGMPILKAFESKTVIVVKRSLAAGFSGIKNELFERKNAMMLFGDAKEVMVRVKEEVEGL